MASNSMFNPGRGKGGGSGGTPVTVINDLNSTSASSALSANMGRELKALHDEHIDKIASTSSLGHVMVDGTSILIDANGVISAVGGGVSPSGRFYEQAVLDTTEIDQTSWKIPFVDFNYPQDLLIVSQNTTLLSIDRFNVIQTGNDWFVNIPNDSGFPLPIVNNKVFVIAIKGFGGGTTSIVQNSYEIELATTSVGQDKWEITSNNFDPINDTVFPIYNSTMLTQNEYTIAEDAGKYYITLNDVPNDIPAQFNNLTLKVLFNTVSNGMNDISGQLLIDKSVPEKKLMQNVQDKINSKTIVFEELGEITIGDKEAHRMMPFSCNVKSVDAVLLQTSSQPLEFNIKQSSDLQTWSNVLPNDIIIPPNTNITTMNLTGQVELLKGKVIRLSVTNTTGDAESLSINLNAMTI